MKTSPKPFAESCVQNYQPILSVIKPLLVKAKALLEIGSGTGQHAVYFANQLPHLRWQPSDREPYLNGIKHWLDDARNKNVLLPIQLDVLVSTWPIQNYDAVYTANTLHIMAMDAVEALFRGAGQCLQSGGQLLIYGPFNYNGAYTSESNAAFDQWLKNRDINSGIKPFEAIAQLASDNAMQLENDFDMPANNRLLHFIKQ